MAKSITTQHIGDRDIDEVIEHRRQKENRMRPNSGTLMNVYRSEVNPRVIAFTFGYPPTLDEGVRMALRLALYRSDVIVGHHQPRRVA